MSRWGVVALMLGIALAPGIALLPSLWNGFVDWDDTSLVVENGAYRGFGLGQLRWMASNTLLGHYVPATWLSFAVDYVVWGLRPVGYHLTNLLLHSANAVLVFILATRLLEGATRLPEASRRVGAAVAALLFALHPLRVEAVTWVTGRRDVLSGFWFLLMLVAYVGASGAVGRRRRRLLGGSLAAYALALLSKEIVMTAPVVLVALDVYPLHRLSGDSRQWSAPRVRAVWLEKVPYAILALVTALISYGSQTRGADVVTLGPPQWLGQMVFTLWFPLYKTVAPLRLSPLYELPLRIDPLEGRFLIAGIAVVAVTLIVLALRRAWPAGLATWLSYAALLAPTAALAHAGPQLTADRYSYLPGLGLAILAGGAAGRLWQSRPRVVGTVAVAVLAGLGSLSWAQSQVWHDTERLWRHAVWVDPGCAVCHLNLGTWLQERGLYADAREEFERSLAIRPDRVLLHLKLGLALAGLGRFADAITHYRRVLDVQPDNILVRSNVAAALMREGQLREAVEELHRVLVFSRPEAAFAYFRDDVAANPDRAIPRLGLVQAYAALGREDLARQHQAVLRRLNPALARELADALPVVE